MTAVFHHLDVYDVDLHVCRNRREWNGLCRRVPDLELVDLPDSAGRTDFAVWVPKKSGVAVPVVVFWIKAGIPDAGRVNTCAHEASHAANLILSWTGHDTRGRGGADEPSAYLTGWLTEWLWTHTSPEATT